MGDRRRRRLFVPGSFCSSGGAVGGGIASSTGAGGGSNHGPTHKDGLTRWADFQVMWMGDHVAAIIDQVALEGLDGITLQALNTRILNLDNARSFPCDVTTMKGQQMVLDILLARARTQEDLTFFRLPSARPDLVIYNRYEHVDPDLGVVSEPNQLPEDPYPFQPVIEEGATNVDGTIKGSCSNFQERVDITKDVLSKGCTLESMRELVPLDRLAIVASLQLRARSILGQNYDPLLVESMSSIQWCLLERIGRARRLGDVTQGKTSLTCLAKTIPPKTQYYFRKRLVQKGLITKQELYQKIENHNVHGLLFHLPRFYVERKTKAQTLIHSIICYLKNQRDCVAPYQTLIQELGIQSSIKKLTKNSEFKIYFKTDVKVPYRFYYPDAKDWKSKDGQERQVRSFELIDKDIDPEVVWHGGKKDSNAGDETVEDLDDLADEGGNRMLKDKSNIALNRSMLANAYRVLVDAGPTGMAQMDFSRKLGIGKLESRAVHRYHQRRDLADQYLADMGRQRAFKLVAKCYKNSNTMIEKLNAEKEKMEELRSVSRKRQSSESRESPDDSCIPSTSQLSIGEQVLGEKVNKDCEPRLVDDVAEHSIPSKKPKTEVPGKTIKTSEVQEETASDEVMVEVTPGNLPTPKAAKKSKSAKPLPKESRDVGKNELAPSQQSFRRLKRENTILEAIRTFKVVEDHAKLHQLIKEQEAEEPEQNDGVMDRKSLHRILGRLAADGQIKTINIKLTLPPTNKTKTLFFVCDPSVDETHTIIQSAVEQAKMKFSIGTPGAVKKQIPNRLDGPEEFSENSVNDSCRDLLEMNTEGDVRDTGDSASIAERSFPRSISEDLPVKRVSGRQYGLQPKFIRMRELHLLLFYLCRGYEGQLLPPEERADFFKSLSQKEQYRWSSDLQAELADMPIYSKEVSWKMFLSELPMHKGWKSGWCLMCDVLLRLPLSLFVMLVNVTLQVEGVDEYLNHPVRRHYLIRSLPSRIRSKLLDKRKYIFSIYEIATRLAYVGVVQFGPQKLKEKDQVFLYVNQRASLLDTVSSARGYHQIEIEREYPVRTYTFDTLDMLEKYWYEMYEICMHTPLGGSSALLGKEVVFEFMDKKPAMQATLQPKTSQEADQDDVGDIPGDHLGAAGLDSSIFAFLKRNWTWNTRQGIKPAPPPSKPTTSSAGNSAKSNKKIVVTMEPNIKRSQKGQKRKSTEQEGPSKHPSHIVAKKSSPFPARPGDEADEETPRRISKRGKTYSRVMQKRGGKIKRKPYYDERDRMALKLMRKLRVEWTNKEDSFLLLCKVAGTFLCQRPIRIQYSFVRNLLHKRFRPESLNKTSRACQRRINYMLKNKATTENVSLFLADLEQDSVLSSKFSEESIQAQLDAASASSSNAIKEQEHERIFEELVDRLVDKYKSTCDQELSMQLPDTMDGLMDKFTIVFPSKSASGDLASSLPGPIGGSQGFPSACTGATDLGPAFCEPTTVDEIRQSVVASVIMSSLSVVTDKSNWAYHLYKIYQQYPDHMLRSVMQKLRAYKMVSIKKHAARSKMPRSTITTASGSTNSGSQGGGANYLPLSSSPYQLSVSFIHKFLSRYSYDIFGQSWQIVRQLAFDKVEGKSEGLHVEINEEGGYAAAIVSLMAKDRLLFQTEVPQQVIVLDPNLALVDENYVRILQRYKELLRNAGNMDEDDRIVMEANDPTGSKVTKTKPITVRKACSKEELRRLKKPKSNSLVEEDTPDRDGGDRNVEKNLSDGILINESMSGTIPASNSGNCTEDERSQLQLAKCASRVALYLMREELKDGSKEAGGQPSAIDNIVQHSHDYFVISSCKITAKLSDTSDGTLDISAGEEKSMCVGGATSIPNKLLPADIGCLTNILNRYGLNLYGGPLRAADKDRLKKICLKTEHPKIEKVASNFKKTIKPKDLRQIYDRICQRGELGMSAADLRQFCCEAELSKQGMVDVIEALLSHNMVVRTGIVSMRVVATVHAEPWILHSFKLLRLQLEGARTIFPGNQVPSVYQEEASKEVSAGVDVSQTTNKSSLRKSSRRRSKSKGEEGPTEEPTDGPVWEKISLEDESDVKVTSKSSEASQSKGTSEKGTQPLRRTSRKPKPKDLRLPNEPDGDTGKVNLGEAVKKVEDKVELVDMFARPWIKVDATLNRKIFDRMLGAILGYVMQKPGQRLAHTALRFAPAIQPYQTRELVEILQEMGCLKLLKVVKQKCSLFQKSPPLDKAGLLEKATMLDEATDVVVEPCVDAIVILGQFIGEKQHSAADIYQCPCHPKYLA